jgi:hypothetical protein
LVVQAEPQPGFPRVYAVAKWSIVASLVALALVAAAFWTLVLGNFAGSGFHARGGPGNADADLVITPDCAWPYRVDDPAARPVCRLSYNMSPEQREEALRTRKQSLRAP